jgi:hypothetical protein
MLVQVLEAGERDRHLAAAGMVADHEGGSGVAIAHVIAGLHARGRLARRERPVLYGDIAKLSYQY